MGYFLLGYRVLVTFKLITETIFNDSVGHRWSENH